MEPVAIIELYSHRWKPVGVIGEVYPEVLERWQISMPVVAFDLNLSQLIALG